MSNTTFCAWAKTVRSRHRRLAAAVLPLTLVLAALATQSAASIQPAQASSRSVARGSRPAATAGKPQLALNDLRGRSHTITLITGDQVTLTAAGSGRYSVSVSQAARPDGASSDVIVTSESRRGQRDQMYAIPQDAEPLIQAGRLDKNLFNVEYLASHEAHGTLSVVLHYANRRTGGALTAPAGRLPASTSIRKLPAANAADLAVNLQRAGSFWAALTSATANPDRPAAPQLAKGIASLTLPGGRPGAHPARGPATAPLYTVTETINPPTNSQPIIGAGYLWPQIDDMVGLTGTGAGQDYQATQVTCATQINNNCGALQITFSVPAGTYMLRNLVNFQVSNRTQHLEADNPQLTVADNTDVTFDASDAHQITVSTQKPTETYNAVFSTYRYLPDGSLATNLLAFAGYGLDNYWAIPTQPVTLGTFHIKVNWILGKPLLAMSIRAPRNIQLHPLYPFGEWAADPSQAVRFSGTRKLTVAYANLGRKQDFSGLDVHGKLVLIRRSPGSCYVSKGSLENALRAGAAGVLIDPGSGTAVQVGLRLVGGACRLPVLGNWVLKGGTNPRIPFASLPAPEASTLRNLLSRGTVKITVTDGGESPYVYELTTAQEGSVPDSLNYVFANQQLVNVDTSFHYAKSVTFSEGYADWLPNDNVAAGTAYSFAGPRAYRVYYVASPSLVYERYVDAYPPRNPNEALSVASTFDIFSRRGMHLTEDWFDAPEVPGAPTFPIAAIQTQGSKFAKDIPCSACRQGNIFLPWTVIATSDPQIAGDNPSSGGMLGTNPKTVHLYQNKKEIPQTANPFGLSEYTLPPQQGTYQLTYDSGDIHTDWTFSSAKPATDQIPGGFYCISGFYFGATGPCQADPLVFLRYNGHVNLANMVTTPGTHQLTISAYHQAPDAPAVTSLNVWTSTDGGATWRKAALTSDGNGTYTASYQIPQLSRTSGAVSLKAQAQDAGGNTVSQTIYNAYNLTSSSKSLDNWRRSGSPKVGPHPLAHS